MAVFPKCFLVAWLGFVNIEVVHLWKVACREFPPLRFQKIIRTRIICLSKDWVHALCALKNEYKTRVQYDSTLDNLCEFSVSISTSNKFSKLHTKIGSFRNGVFVHSDKFSTLHRHASQFLLYK